MTHNTVLLALLGIGFVIWALMGTPLSELQATRYMLAWGLDRSGPQWLARVNDRVHTPVAAIVLCTVTGEIALLALINIAQASLLGALLAQIAAFILVSACRHRLPLPAEGPVGIRRRQADTWGARPWRSPGSAA